VALAAAGRVASGVCRVEKADGLSSGWPGSTPRKAGARWGWALLHLTSLLVCDCGGSSYVGAPPLIVRAWSRSKGEVIGPLAQSSWLRVFPEGLYK
jgi:hypothetical protein